MDKDLEKLISIAIELTHKNIWDNTAIDINTRIIELNKSEAAAYTRLAKCYCEQGQILTAIEIYKQVIVDDYSELTTRAAKNFLKRNEKLLDDKKLLDSVKNYDEAIAVAMSMRRTQKGGYNLIIEVLRKAYLYADKTYQKIKIAAELKKIKQIDAAKKILESLKKENFNNSALDITYAAALRKEKEYEEAELLYKLVLEKEPKNMAALVGLVATLKDMKRCEEAFVLCENVTGFGLRDPYFLRVLYSLALKLDDVEKADKAYKILSKYYESFEPLKFLNILINHYEEIDYKDGINRMTFIKTNLETTAIER